MYQHFPNRTSHLLVTNGANETTGEVGHGETANETSIKPAIKNRIMKFTIANERFCQDRDFDILIYIFSAVKNIDQRVAIRAAWGNSSLLTEKVKVIYVIGRTSEKDMQKRVEEESNKFKDIVQGDFMDSYYGLANKSIAAVNWIRKYCNTVKVLIKTDDDLAVDMERIIKSVKPYLNRPRHVMCYIWKNSLVIRHKSNKFHVSVEEFPGKVYPTYCNGWVYMYTADIVEELCKYMDQTETFRIEDVWTTGIVMKNLQNLTRIHMQMLFGGVHRAVIHQVRASSMKDSTSKAIKMRI